MDIRVLGPVELHANGRPVDIGPRRQRFVLAVLALDVNRVVPIDRLVELTWPNDPPRTAVHAVRVMVSRLRAVLASARDGGGDIEITTCGTGYSLRADPSCIDAGRFLHLVEVARTTVDDEKRRAVLTEALELWTGPALSGTTSPATHAHLCRGLEEARLSACRDLVDAHLSLGRYAELIPELERLTAVYPFDEHFHQQLMLALYRAGRQADALGVYRKLREVLAGELGIEPSQPVRDLEGAILRQDAGLRPAPTAARSLPVPAQLPPALPSFIDRPGGLADLDAMVSPDRSTPGGIAVVSGAAGVGKTTLAVQWAHRVAAHFPDGQLYVNLRGFDPIHPALEPGVALRGFLEALGVLPGRVPSDTDARTALYRSLLAGKRVLVVLDNAWDVAQVRPLLPGASGCVTIVTSRRQLLPLVAAEGARLTTLDLLTEAQARLLLDHRLGPERVAAEPAAAAEIIARCARLPLALAIVAGRAAARPGFPLTELTAELRATDGGLDALSLGDPTTDVRAAFTWSYRTLGADAARLLRLLSGQPGPDISVGAAASLAGLPVRQIRRLLAELTGGHLIAEHSPGRYTMHDLLRAFLIEHCERTDPPDARRVAVLRLLDHYLHTAHAAALVLDPLREPIALRAPEPGVAVDRFDSHPQALLWFDTERPVLLAAIDHAGAAGFDAHAWGLAWAMADALQRRGRWDELDATRHVAMAAALRLATAPELAYAHRKLSSTYQRMRRFPDAHVHLKRAVELYRAAGDTMGLVDAHLTLAHLWYEQNRTDEALREAQQALDLSGAVSSPSRTALSLNAVGWYQAQLGEYRLAIDACQQALTVQRELDDRPGQAATWDSLGYAYHRLARPARALACYRQAVELCRDLGHRFEEATVLTNLGDAQADRDLRAARASWKQALVIFDDLGHPDADRLRDRLAAPPARDRPAD